MRWSSTLLSLSSLILPNSICTATRLDPFGVPVATHNESAVHGSILVHLKIREPSLIKMLKLTVPSFVIYPLANTAPSLGISFSLSHIWHRLFVDAFAITVANHQGRRNSELEVVNFLRDAHF